MIHRPFNLLKQETASASEPFYLLLLALYLLNFLTEYVAYKSIPISIVGNVRMCMIYAFILLLGIYVGSIIVIWIMKAWTGKTWIAVPAFALLIAVLYLSAAMQRNMFDGWMMLILALLAYGKSYSSILKLYLFSTASIVILAIAGIPFGLTKMATKDGAYGSGLALGFTHPNVWGFYAFLLMMLVWVLYISKRSIPVRLAFYIFSVAVAVFMVFVPKCRTQAVMMALFPIIDLMSNVTSRKKFLRWLLILSPVFCLILTIILGEAREWLVEHTFGTYIENFSKRFIQSGLAIKEHGFPIFGELIRFQNSPPENLAGHNFSLYIMDNAYSSFLIYRGLSWMVPGLAWLCYANWMIVREKMTALLTVSVMMCLVALMERYPLEIYNFVFLFPLAGIIPAEKGEKSL